MKALWKLTGGRPMKYLGYHMTDCVTGDTVNRYEDKFGRIWMATNRWGWFRVEVSIQND